MRLAIPLLLMGLQMSSATGCFAAGAAAAQRDPVANAAAADDATLFVNSCMNFSGSPQALRGWLAQKGFGQVPEQTAKAVLNGHSAEVFSGSTKWGGPALVSSLDNGDCVLTVSNVDKDVVDAILQSIIGSGGATFAADPGHPTLDDHADRSVEEVMLQDRKWVIMTANARRGPAVQVDMAAIPVGGG